MNGISTNLGAGASAPGLTVFIVWHQHDGGGIGQGTYCGSREGARIVVIAGSEKKMGHLTRRFASNNRSFEGLTAELISAIILQSSPFKSKREGRRVFHGLGAEDRFFQSDARRSMRGVWSI